TRRNGTRKLHTLIYLYIGAGGVQALPINDAVFFIGNDGRNRQAVPHLIDISNQLIIDVGHGVNILRTDGPYLGPGTLRGRKIFYQEIGIPKRSRSNYCRKDKQQKFPALTVLIWVHAISCLQTRAKIHISAKK